jgi:hypothetical protein
MPLPASPMPPSGLIWGCTACARSWPEDSTRSGLHICTAKQYNLIQMTKMSEQEFAEALAKLRAQAGGTEQVPLAPPGPGPAVDLGPSYCPRCDTIVRPQNRSAGHHVICGSKLRDKPAGGTMP